MTGHCQQFRELRAISRELMTRFKSDQAAHAVSEQNVTGVASGGDLPGKPIGDPINPIQ